ncbi:hypothetical protein DET48_11888 [Vibrio diazotrophicus]|uniref:Uncharacterized protein n=1 Tax=Vibrio diazotrophicus TaxID=685 RepID=A0A329E8W6_VIBDI|nr:hypothetical protein DET48_11888 [Vibrio diazotrophicus]
MNTLNIENQASNRLATKFANLPEIGLSHRHQS